MNNLINREAAIDGFYEMASDVDHLCTVGDYILFLESLPAYSDLPKMGKWIKNGNRFTCPFCGIGFTTNSDEIKKAHRYCYYCGARMVEDDEMVN